MRIGRTLPPAASPIYIRDIINGFRGLARGRREIERFGSELKDYFGVKHCLLVSSGKAALALILLALQEINPDRDEVIIPAYCCYSVPSAIVRAGLKVRLCDVDPETLNFDFQQLREMLNHNSDRVLAVVAVHIYCVPADVDRTRALIGNRKIFVVEDAAQVMGATSAGKKLGTLGDVNFFSLGRSKAISAYEGGVILTSRRDIAERVRDKFVHVSKYSSIELLTLMMKALLLTVLQLPSLFWFPKLLPFLKVGDTFYEPKFRIARFSGFQAGLLRNWKHKLHRFIDQRTYWSGKWANINPSKKAFKNYLSNGQNPNFLRFPLKIDHRQTRGKILSESDARGLGVMFTYPKAICDIPEIEDHFVKSDFPNARNLAETLVTLPVHPYVNEMDFQNIVDLISTTTSKAEN